MKKVTLDQLDGKEVKALLEQITDDGKINTVPELFRFLDEVPDGMSLRDYIISVAGSPDELPDNSVGTRQIENEGVMMEDLNSEIKDTMMTGEDRVTQEELEQFQV